MKRVCVNCGTEITFLKSLLNNKCCSYECDLENEEKVNLYERKVWEERMSTKVASMDLPIKRRYRDKSDYEENPKTDTKKTKVKEETINKEKQIKEENRLKEEEADIRDEFVIENIQKEFLNGVFEEFVDETDTYEFVGAPEEDIIPEPGEELNF